jgi:hypothetical protein
MDAEQALKVWIEIGLITPENADKARAALAGVGDESDKAGGKVEGFNIRGRELYRVAAMLNRIMPGAGDALRAFGRRNDEGALAMIGVAASLGMVIRLVHDYKKSAQEADESVSKLMASKFGAGVIEEVKKAWEDAELAEELYYHNLVRNDEDTQKRVADSNLSRVKTQAAAQQQIDDAQKGVELASIEKLEHVGVVSHEAAAKMKHEIDVKYMNLRLALEREADAQELAIQTQLLASEKQKQTAAGADVKDKFDKANAAEVALKEHEKKVEADRQSITEAEDQMKASGITAAQAGRIRELYELGSGKDFDKTKNLDEQYMELMKHAYYGTSYGANLTAGEQAEAVGIFAPKMLGGQGIQRGQVDAYSAGESQVAGLKIQLRKDEVNDKPLREAAEFTKSDLEEANRSLGELNKTVNELSVKVGLLADQNKANEANATTVARLKSEAEGIKAGDVPATVEAPGRIRAAAAPASFVPTGTSAAPDSASADAALDAKARADVALLQQYAALVNAGGQLDAHQNQIMQQMVSMIVGHKANASEISKVLSEINVFNGEILNVFETFRSQLQEVRNQMRTHK